MLFFVLRGCCSPLRQYYGAGSGGPGSCALRVPRLSYAPAGFCGRRRAFFTAARVPRGPKVPECEGWPYRNEGPRESAPTGSDCQRRPNAAPWRRALSISVAVAATRVLPRSPSHKSGSREILSSLKDPSAMHGCGGSAEDEIPGESGRRLRAFFCERLPSSAKSRPPRARKRCFEARSSRLAKHQSSLTSAEHANRSWS